MDPKQAKEQVAEAGRFLLQQGLVARTWGNVSCRIDENTMAITPSGLGYEEMTADDIVIYHMGDGSYEGSRKPSSEKGVHETAYRQFPQAGFVVHTHQTYASAIGLAGFGFLSPVREEAEALEGVALARYGLPGTKTLRKNVRAALSSHAHCVLMAQHGAVIVGRDQKEACDRALLLETVCRRACQGLPEDGHETGQALLELSEEAGRHFKYVSFTSAPAVRETASSVSSFRAQLDDMAQMIGARLRTVEADPKSIIRGLKAQNAVLVKGLGAICQADTKGDVDALRLLTEKACISFLHTRALGVKSALSPLDTLLMRVVYKRKYSKKIGG